MSAKIPHALLLSVAVLGAACQDKAVKPETAPAEKKAETPPAPATFEYATGDRFGDSGILRYDVPGFSALSLQQKKLAYYLYEAALSGRDIIYDQKYRHNLSIRRTLEAIIDGGGLSKGPEDEKLIEYAKKVWFARGIHHDYSKDKFLPGFSKEYFETAVEKTDAARLPLLENETPKALAKRIGSIIFDPELDTKAVNTAKGADLIASSANNFYQGLTEKEVQSYYSKLLNAKDPTPISVGLNSKLEKVDGKIVEKVWKVGGMYGPALEKIVGWLKKASSVAEDDKQKKALDLLISYYETGDLKTFNQYNIAWVQDTDSMLDTINGFIEVYGDAMAFKGTWEAVVELKDLEATKRIAALADNAQWFEDNSPILPEHKKKDVVGISARVVTVVVEGGDTAPTTPIGINLPNSNWIRAEHGSKSVNLGNIVQAYQAALSSSPVTKEFTLSDEELKRGKELGPLAYNLKVDLHEVIGHASGKLNPGVKTPKETLKNYSNAMEEGRADLVALYYIMDPKLVELGVMPSLDVGKAGYDGYIRSALLTQLARIEEGKSLEEAHMRNRHMVASWAYEKGKKDNVIERVVKDSKTYFVVRDYEKLRALFAELLREVQRIKSEGDFEAARDLIETYGVKLDPALHHEVLERYRALNVPTYYGFIQPKLIPVTSKDGEIEDVKIEYPKDFMAQQLEYSKEYSFLPNYN